MFDGYRIRAAVTSVALTFTLGATPAGTAGSPKKSCSNLSQLYSPRVLRALRARLMMTYVRAHEGRALIATQVLRHQQVPSALLDPERIDFHSQESDSPRMKHLLDYVVIHCL